MEIIDYLNIYDKRANMEIDSMNSNVLKPLTEVKYLSAENARRYRYIIRYFYLEYEKINYWLYKEDIYNKMIDSGLFFDYTMEMCQQDLQSLTEWKNLLAIQDSQKVKTIEDFKNRKFRYQLSQYTVEIERMTIRLENLNLEGSSLEPTLIVKFYSELEKHKDLLAKSDEEIHVWLEDLFSDFMRLNQKYQDYIKTLNSAKAEELMKTTEFLLFKDNLISYLRIFVKAMQEKGMLISSYIQKMDKSEIIYLINRATDYELSIPRIDFELEREEVFENYLGKWTSIEKWFVGKDGVNEVDRLNIISQEIIRKITKYAQQIVEMNNRGSNRKEQYYYIASVFDKCESIQEAHNLSAYIFGVTTCLNARHVMDRKTENIHSGVYDEEPSCIQFDSHSRIVSSRSVRKAASDYSFEKMARQLELQDKMEKQRLILNNLIKDGVLDFQKLPIIDSFTRKTILSWVSKAIANNNNGKTDDGAKYRLDRNLENIECKVICEDGNFYMPSFKLIFEESL